MIISFNSYIFLVVFFLLDYGASHLVSPQVIALVFHAMYVLLSGGKTCTPLLLLTYTSLLLFIFNLMIVLRVMSLMWSLFVLNSITYVSNFKKKQFT